MTPDRDCFRSLVAGALLAAIVASPCSIGAALAQPLPTAVAAVIDYQRILRDAAAARSIRDQIEARRKSYQEEISKQEQELHEEDKAFAKQRSVLDARGLRREAARIRAAGRRCAETGAGAPAHIG